MLGDVDSQSVPSRFLATLLFLLGSELHIRSVFHEQVTVIITVETTFSSRTASFEVPPYKTASK